MTNLKMDQAAKTSRELKRNFEMIRISKQKVLDDLQFTEDQLNEALDVFLAQPSDVWKLRDYIEEKLGNECIPFSILKNNVWHKYEKTWE